MPALKARPDESIWAVTDAYRTSLITMFTELAKDARATNPEQLGRQLALLHDGIHAGSEPGAVVEKMKLATEGVWIVAPACSARLVKKAECRSNQ